MSELQQAINEMRNMRESYDQLGAAAGAYNTGKVELAQNITSKGVEASATETLPELAEKVAAISQETYEINGGEMYAKQLFGSLETPNYWNLYEVLEQLLSDGRLVQYGGILLAEYYRGYDSLTLAGAGAGGAYVVSDLDENGQFKMYTEDTTHTWATKFDGKGNRWVAYCFADEYHDFQITDTNTSPRSIFIGRKVGTITSLVNGRISEIVVTDGNILDRFDTGTYTQNWPQKVSIKNLSIIDNKVINNNASMIYIQASKIIGKAYAFGKLIGSAINTAIIEADEITNSGNDSGICEGGGMSYGIVKAEKISFSTPAYGVFRLDSANNSNITICCLGIEEGNFYPVLCNNAEFASMAPNFKKIYVGYKTNDKTKSVNISHSGYSYTIASVEDIELQDGWCKPLSLRNSYIGLTEANMYAHILQRLKQDEPDCGVGVTITLGSTNLAKLTSEESQALLAELRGTYGYTFA
jgi:hypothetical protein